MSAVATIDTTGVQSLVDTRRQINRYADREVEFHFAHITSPWVSRALIAGGFGTGKPLKEIIEVAPVVPSSASSRSLQPNPDDANTGLRHLGKYIQDSSYKDGRFKLNDEYDLEDKYASTKDDHWGLLISQE